MLTFLLIAHVALMSTSLFVTLAMVFTSLLDKSIPQTLIRSNLVVTITGIGSGVLLLAQTAIDYKCILLGTYLIAFAAAYRYVTTRNQRLATSSAA